MNVTSGPTGFASSASAALASSLVSRLKERLSTAGSTVYRQTWKEKATPSRRSYWAHTASALRTSGNDSTGWSTAKRDDGVKSIRSAEGAMKEAERKGANDLNTAAVLAAWATPTAHEKVRSEEFRKGRELNAREALVSPWATPAARDKDTGDLSKSTVREDGRIRDDTVARQAVSVVSGGTPISSTAETAKPVAFRLNPGFSLWLMGYPIAWLCCGERVTPSSRKSQRSSSPRTST